MNQISAPLDRLGISIARKELNDKEREIHRRIDCCDRLVDAIDELLAEASDDSLPDYVITNATHKLERARREHAEHVTKAAELIKEADTLRRRIGRQPHILTMISNELMKSE